VFASVTADEAEGKGRDVPAIGRNEPLTVLYRETAAIADAALRMVASFPESATAQLQLCEGLEGILNTVAARLRVLTAGVSRHRAEHERVAWLAALFTDLLAGQRVEAKALHDIAEDILAEARASAPLTFAPADVSRPVSFAAGHGVNVARVLGRLVRHDPGL